jgi:hypothetical protein
MKMVSELGELKEKKFKEMIERLKDGELIQEKYTQWFHVGNFFSPMGVKTVGEFCQLVKDMSFVNDSKYLIGFQDKPKFIPDLGEIEWECVKMSGRTPPLLERRVLRGEMPGLDYLVPKASEAVGGFADATHKIAAATIIDKDKEEEFIKAFEKLVDEYEGG